MVVRFYSSVAPETTLSAGITGANTSITVGSVTGFPANTPYTLALDYEGLTEELVQVNSAAGTTLTVARAVDGTSAASHNAGARVRHVSSARDFADSRSHENTGNGVHGLLPGEVIVGTTSVQTLVNKTLTAPVIDNPTINGNVSGSPTILGGTLTGDTAARVRLQNTTDVSLSSTNHAFQIGLDSAANLRMDNNEIIAANNGAASALFVNPDGGNISSFNNLAADSTTNTYTVNGVMNATQHQSTRPGATTTTFSSRINGDTQSRLAVFADGSLNWGSGAAGQDVNLYRNSSTELRTDDSLTVGGATLTVAGSANVAVTTTTADLVVTGNSTFASITIPAATLLSAASGWSVAGTSAGITKAGHTTVEMNFTRTGADITVNANGTMTPSSIQLGTVAASFRHNSALGILTTHAGNTNGAGTAQVLTTGDVNLVKWSPNSTIQTGNTVSITLTWPLP